MKFPVFVMATLIASSVVVSDAEAKPKGLRSSRSTMQHALNVTGPRGQARSTAEHALNDLYKAGRGTKLPKSGNKWMNVPPGQAKKLK